MGPKKKNSNKKENDNKETDNKEKIQFLSVERYKLLEASKNRDCFSLDIHTQEPVDISIKQPQRFSAPFLPVREPRIKWPLLDIFTAVDDYEMPRITVWKPFTKAHLNDLNKLNEEAAYLYIQSILPTNYSKLNKCFLKYLIYDVLKWSQRNNLNEKKTSSILGMYLNTHNYFLGSSRRNQQETYDFFKESILLHTLDDPPKSAKILDPFQCKAGLSYFCKTYLPVLPLLRVQLLPNYRLRLETIKKEELPQ